MIMMISFNYYLGRIGCTYNVHKIIHIPASILAAGPLPGYWTWMFERMNLESSKAVHKRSGINFFKTNYNC